MRHLILTFLFGATVSLLLYAQKTKEIIIKFDGSKQIKEKYYVVKSNKSMKHGSYISYHKGYEERYWDLMIYQTGEYKNGKKDSTWTIYKRPSKKGSQTTYSPVDEVQNYKDGAKVGIWEESKENGKVMLRFDHDKGSDIEPRYNTYLSYPRKAVEGGIQGSVKVSYSINADCTISNLSVTSGLNSDCDKAVLESIRELRSLMKKYSLTKVCKEEDQTQEVKFRLR